MARNNVIDCLKGFTILLVVLGHGIQICTNNNFDAFGFRLIYSFHMPLFMFLSGYVAVYAPTDSISRLKSRFIRLVVPFFSWAVVSFGISCVGKGAVDWSYWIDLFRNVDTGLWFLWVLFLIHLLFYLGEKVRFAGQYSLLVPLVLVQFIPYSFLGISFVKMYIVFFSIGYYLNKNSLELLLRKRTVIRYLVLFCTLALYIYLFQYWTFAGRVAFLGVDNYFVRKLYKLVVAVLGILFIYEAFNIHTVCESSLKWLGKNTIEIYTTHAYFINIALSLLILAGSFNLYVNVMASSLFGLLCSLVVAHFLKKKAVTSLLFYGNRN